MTLFVLTVVLTLVVSGLCSVLEAMILSTRSVEIEELKLRRPRAGRLLRRFRDDLEGTISSILAVNTVANTLGSIVVGAMAARLFGTWWLGVTSGLMTLGILVLSEIIPKNLGVIYRTKLQPFMVFPLAVICRMASPVAFACAWLVSKILPRPEHPPSTNEIAFLADREAKEGRMSVIQHRLVHAALDVSDTRIAEVMTPRSVVETVESGETVDAVRARFERIPFARLPVINGEVDDVMGVVRRKDILHTPAGDAASKTMQDIMKPAAFIPEMGTISGAVEQLVAHHQQLGVVVDEFGAYSGVVTLEDFFEFFVGREFYEPDDPAIDMRELALRKSHLNARKKKSRNKPS